MIKIKTQKPAAGKILISEPFLPDPNFSRSVVYLCEHNEKGTVGYILNRPLKTRLDSIMKELENLKITAYLGGPVQVDTLHYLHRIEALSQDDQEVADGIYWGGNFEVLKSLAAQNQLNENDIRFFIGYSGWDKDQLDKEIKQNSWIVTNTKAEHVFSRDENIWRNILKEMGDNFAVVSNFPEDPSLN